MSDVIFLVVIVGFFAVAFGLLRACERIIGSHAVAPASAGAPEARGEQDAEVPA
jgi:hypothetical protein